MSEDDFSYEEGIISNIKDYIRQHDIGAEASELIAKLSFAFAKQVAFDLNELLKEKDVQTNDLKKILEESDFPEISNAVSKHLSDILIERKRQKFEELKQTDYVSKNYHFEFARQLLSSKHRESSLTPANEYSDDDV